MGKGLCFYKKNNQMQDAQQLIKTIKSQFDLIKAAWLENYVKHGIQSYGVGTPALRQMVKTWELQHWLQGQPQEQQLATLNLWMQQDYTEPQLAAILWLQLYGLDKDATWVLDVVEYWLDQHWIIDWNVCDWLCVRVLEPLLERDPTTVVPRFQSWNRASYVWKARCSLVPFAVHSDIAIYRDWLAEGGAVLIQREERFCKTAVGWALREYSKQDWPWVEQFLERYADYTTKEVERNARKYQ